MNFLRDIREKTWIDWVKIIVALDIASVGIGLIIGLNFHVLANIFGFISRILFGILYLFVAVLILKRVFPEALHVDDENEIEEQNIDVDIKQGVTHGRRLSHTLFKKIKRHSDLLIKEVDIFLDKIELFFKKKKKEAVQEVDELLHK
jgi:hypothetical protein